MIETLRPAADPQSPIYQEIETLIKKKSLDEHIVVTGPADKKGVLSCYLHHVPDMKPLSAIVIVIRELSAYLEDARINRQKEINQAMIKAQDHERNELSKELNENVNQLLSSAMVLLSSVNMDGTEDDHLYFRKSRQYLDQVIREIRKLSRSLNTSIIEEVGLKPPVQEVISNLQAALSIEVKLEYDDSLDEILSYQQKLTIYRIIQEQVKNIIRHSRAGKATIALRKANGMASLRIQDDGIGFDTENLRSGLGLINIRNRVDGCQGVLRVLSSPSRGCTLEVEIPIV